VADQSFDALKKLFPTAPAPTVGAVQPAVGPVDYSGAFDRLKASGQLQADSGGSTVGNIFSSIGRGLLQIVDKAMIPQRAIASFAKELNDAWASSGVARWLGTGGHVPDWLITQRTPEQYTQHLKDIGAQGGFSWSDFTKQIAERKGMGDYFTQINPNRSLGYRRVMGLVGDVATDPLMWTHPGVANLAAKGTERVAETAAQKAAYEGLDAAIKSGSSKSITNALIKSATEAGFAMKEGGGFADEGLNALLVETQKRGVGALTPKALRLAGVDAEMANKLGIGELGRTYFHGAVTIPGSSAVTNVIEGAKGSIKGAIRETGTAQFLRGKFAPEAVRALRQIAFDSSASIGQRSEALLVESAMAAPKRAATMWGKLTQLRVEQNWSGAVRDAEGKIDKAATKAAKAAGAQSWHNVPEHVAQAATHSLETGGTGELEVAARKEFKQIHDELVAAGVPVGNMGENYFPHQVLPEARIAAGKFPEARKILDSLTTQNGFQFERILKPGMPFLNETAAAGGKNLVEGSAKEINDRFMEKFGVKLFDDNLQTVMPKYIKQSEHAMQRAMQNESLKTFGLTGPLLERVDRQLNPDKSWIKDLADIQARKDALVAEQQVQLLNGATIRRDGLLQARQEYAKQAVVLRSQARKIDSEIAKLERVVVGSQKRLEDVTAKATEAASTVKRLRGELKSLQGDARLQAVKDLQAAEKALVVAKRDVKQWTGTVKQVAGESGLSAQQLTERLSPARQRLLALRGEKAALEGQISGLRDVLNQVSDEQRKTLLATERDVNRSWLTAQARAKQLATDVTAATDATDRAVNAHIIAQADGETQKQFLSKTLTELQTQIDALTGLPSIPKKSQIKLGLQNDLRERFNTLLEVLNAPDTSPELKAIAGLETAAAEADMAAAELGDHIGLMNDMIKITKDKKIIEKISRVPQAGAVKIGENLQLPQWIYDATTVQHAIGDITKAGAMFEKYMNLFRAYTTFMPGFHVRNAYTALFNMYLEGGVEAFAGIKKWHQFYDMVQKNPENFMVAAEQKFGAETAAKLNDALEVMYGSGAGHVGAATAASSFGRGSFNPFDPNNRMIAGSRRVGSWVEDHVRGAHALAVLERGGSKDLASDIVAKWHFNYSDLGSWDRKAKMIIPFWTFFSRDLALQAQTYVRNIPRYNRAISNLERNMTLDSQDPTVVPAYFQKAGAIRISGGQQPTYWFPDLPMTLFPSRVSQMTSISQLPEFFSNVSPIIKVPLEAFAGKSMYTGIPTKDKYVPAPLGLKQLLQVSGIEVPGDVIQNTPSGPVMKASWAQAFNSLLPGFGQVERMLPVSEGNGLSWNGLFTKLTGIGTRKLDEKAIAGEMIRRKQEAALKAKYARSLAGYGG